MSLLDFFKKKPIKYEKPSEPNNVGKEKLKQNNIIAKPQIKITTQVISSNADDIIPVEKRIKNAYASKHGLYPHEILVLDYAESFFTDQESFQGFWWYRYGVKDVQYCLRNLVERGFIKIGDLQNAIKIETTTVLKNELKNHGLKVSGKKEELVQRLLAEVSHEELNLIFSKRTYQLTELGNQALEEEDYIPYIHRHAIEDLDIWSLNKIMYKSSSISYRDKIWEYLNKHSMKYFSVGDFGLYRNCRYHMYLFLLEEKKVMDAVGMLAEVVFYDLSGLNNNYNPEYLYISAKHFFPYKESSVTMAPGIINAVIQCQKDLNLSDEELKLVLLDRMKVLSVPMHLFTPEECVDILFMENCKDIDALTRIYAKAKQRFKQNYPDIKC